MAVSVSSYMLRNRNRSRRFRSKRENDEYRVTLDLTRNPEENIREILTNICDPGDIVEGKRLNYLNAFVKLTLHINGNFTDYGYTTEEILCCLRISLIHGSTHIRSGGFRAVRHVIKTEEDVLCLNKLLIPFLIARSLDLALKSDTERIEVVKLIRKILMLSASNFHIAIARSLVSMANGETEGLRVCLATLAELGTLNPEVFIHSGAVAALIRNLMECQTPKIAEALCGVLLLLLDKPATRTPAAVNLHCFAAPYCDFHYRHGWLDKNRDERELRFNCSRLALLTILRSWPGIMHFCNPADKSGFRAIVDVLYLNQLEVRKAVLDLLYELLGMPQPEWTDEFVVALNAVDPSHQQDSWSLNEGFVAAEGRSILPHLAKTVPSISDMHLSLLLYCFLENGLLGALSDVIATSDTFISVRTTVLLGELLRLIQLLLPPECCNITPALPNLLEYATTKSPQALRAITALQQQHKLMKKRPASFSLFLDYQIQGGHFMKSSSKVDRLKKNKISSAKAKLQQFVSREDDLIKETGVLYNKDPFTWNWNLIRVIIKGDTQTLDMRESTHRTFLKHLVHFYMPSTNRYSHMDLVYVTKAYTIVGVELVKLLVELDDPETRKLLLNLFLDISTQISAITMGKSAHDCLFNPAHMANTQCQSYFLFIGRLGSTREGVACLKDLNIFRQLQHLATTTNHECYVKLIISSLDYREPGPARELLSAVLTCENENSRLYATQFLLVLLRAGVPQFSGWGIELLANQLRDNSRAIHLSALATLQEATELPMCLEKLIKLNPDMLHLGDKGLLLFVKFLSVESGFELLNKNNFVVNEIRRWDECFNYRYAKIVEGDTSDVLTLHQRGEDGRYDKRTSSAKAVRKELFLPPHIYGQLVKHTNGFRMLLEHGSVDTYIHTIELGMCETDRTVQNLKAALWAIAHFASSLKGVEFLNSRGVISQFVFLVQNCQVYSIRATAFYCLGLVATTRFGADCLFRLGWVCTRHDRHDRWPVIEEENWEDERAEDQSHSTHIGSDSERTSSDQPYMGDYNYGLGDDSTTCDELILIESTGPPPVTQLKSLTLPANQTPSAAQHKRSLSESKTFEIIKGHEPKYRDRVDLKLNPEISQRHRNNSTTESTTSGVSSCESVLGRSFVTERLQTLSPIPSSSSLSTLQVDFKMRRHSESSKRPCSQGSDRSTVSPAGSSTGKLSYQDRIGYATIRYLRQPPLFEEMNYNRSSSLFSNERSPFLLRFRKEALDQVVLGKENSITSGQSLSSLSSIQKFSIKDSAKAKGRCYMGICLPQVLTDLFPRQECPDDEVLTDVVCPSWYDSEAGGDVEDRKRQFWHDTQTCLKCSRVQENNNKKAESGAISKKVSTPTSVEETKPETNETLKREILLQIERLANPIWVKQVKQTLFHHKQKNPALFQDLCIFSEVCKLLSESSYRIGPRRVLQELFFDINFEEFYQEPKKILAKERKSTNNPRNKDESSSNEKPSFASLLRDQRQLELANLHKNVFTTVKSVTKGFQIEPTTESPLDRFSPTRYEPRSPPLSSVKEELASNENLLTPDDKIQEISEDKSSDEKTPTEENLASNILNLESLKFTYKENKFPIRHRESGVKHTQK